ncbi:MAG: hypothetical protein ACPG7F_21855, partial [Aggregatilineales bacterium]
MTAKSQSQGDIVEQYITSLSLNDVLQRLEGLSTDGIVVDIQNQQDNSATVKLSYGHYKAGEFRLSASIQSLSDMQTQVTIQKQSKSSGGCGLVVLVFICAVPFMLIRPRRGSNFFAENLDIVFLITAIVFVGAMVFYFMKEM